MLFNSYEFLFGFLPIVAAGFFVIGRFNMMAAAVWLTLASIVFYGVWQPWGLPILLGSIAVNAVVGAILSKGDPLPTPRRRAWLIAGLVFNIGLLGYFKFGKFLPVGISFFTFTQIAFLVDCWRGIVRERKLLHYVLFVTYFPHLVAGPIIHHRKVMPQFDRPEVYRPNPTLIVTGLTLFALGLGKKVVMADSLAQLSDTLFTAVAHQIAPQFLMSWFGTTAFTFSVYLDFSGYSDMAIGLSLLFGVFLPVNFNSPFKSTSIIEFWQRWHITLSVFLRDYIYIPLGGSRQGRARKLLNLMLTALVAGLWHGAAWTFVIWGFAIGGMIVINHLWRSWTGRDSPSSRASALAGWALTFLCICALMVVFRAPTMAEAVNVFRGLLGMNGVSVPLPLVEMVRSTGLFSIVSDQGVWQGLTPPAFAIPLLVVAAIICLALPNAGWLMDVMLAPADQPAAAQKPRLSFAAMMAVGAFSGAAFMLALGLLSRPRPFLYFQF